MATFFDSKQEVIDFQITPHGKRLISKGKFKPAYYSFVDEGIIYDKTYAGISDNQQNDIETRIQDETPTLKTIPLSYGIERDMKEKGNIQEKLLIDELSLLSNSGVQTNYSPSWSISCLKNKIQSTQYNYLSSDGLIVAIPQINLSCSYKEEIRLDKVYLKGIQTQTQEAFEGDTVTFENSSIGPLSLEGISPASLELESENKGTFSTFLTSKHFEDGTIFTIEEDEIVIDLMQLNVGIDEEYEIEVFKYEKDKNGSQITIPLNFLIKENDNVIDDILVDIKENYTMLELDNNKVDYYMDLFCDGEIEQRIVCNYIVPQTKGKGINNNLVCKNSQSKLKTGNLYNNNTMNGNTSIVSDGYGGLAIQSADVGAIDPTMINGKVIC